MKKNFTVWVAVGEELKKTLRPVLDWAADRATAQTLPPDRMGLACRLRDATTPPDVLVLDGGMENIAALIGMFRGYHLIPPGTRVIVVGEGMDALAVRECFLASADDCLALTDGNKDEVLSALRTQLEPPEPLFWERWMEENRNLFDEMFGEGGCGVAVRGSIDEITRFMMGKKDVSCVDGCLVVKAGKKKDVPLAVFAILEDGYFWDKEAAVIEIRTRAEVNRLKFECGLRDVTEALAERLFGGR